MDALETHLESLASLGTLQSRGEFTLAEGQVWSRLSRSLSDGDGCLRFALRWLHRAGASSLSVSTEGPGTLSLVATFDALPLDPEQAQALDLAGADLDLARTAVAAGLLELSPPILELISPQVGWRRQIGPEQGWDRVEGEDARLVRLTLTVPKGRSSLLEPWERDVKARFRASSLPFQWNERAVSGAYSFRAPVLAWRHLRPQKGEGRPLSVQAPREALESFRAARPGQVDAVLGLIAGPLPAGEPAFQLLVDGELLALPEAAKRLPGFCGVLRWPGSKLDLRGDRPVWDSKARGVLGALRQEAIDMAVQLYRRQPAPDSAQAEAAFVGLQTVLLALLEEQRFTEGHLLAQWLRDCLGSGSRLLGEFRTGFTLDRLSALLAEPAGQAQTSLRWGKAAEARVREQAIRRPEVVEEALLITARLELRARRDQREKLSGDTQARLSQLAHRQQARGRNSEAAASFLLLASAAPDGEAARFDYLEQAARAGDLAGLPAYRERLARERAERSQPRQRDSSSLA